MQRQMRFLPHNLTYDKKAWSVGIYLRLSEEDRDKKYEKEVSKSIQNQYDYLVKSVEILNEYGESLYPCRIFKTYKDDDFTGLNFNRSGFQSLKEDIENNLVDMVVVKSLSRLGRNNSQMQEVLKREFERAGREVRVYSGGDNFDSLYDDPMDIKVAVTLMMNEHYSYIQHQNVSIGMHTMQKQGKFIGAFAPYGYEKDPEDKNHLVIDEVAAKVVRRIYQEYLSHTSLKKIARELSEDGIVNPSRYKSLHGSKYICPQKRSEDDWQWTSASVKRILMDEVYTGTLVQHKQVKKNMYDKSPTILPRQEWIRVQNTHDAIIDSDTYHQVQTMMKRVRRCHSYCNHSLFQGLLFCGDCGRSMRRKVDFYQKKSGERRQYLSYQCGTYRDYGKGKQSFGIKGCTSHFMTDQALTQLLLTDINQNFSKNEILALIHQTETTTKPSILKQDTIERQRKELLRYQTMLKTAQCKWLENKLNDWEYETLKEEISQYCEQINHEMELLAKCDEKKDSVLPEARDYFDEHQKLIKLNRNLLLSLIDVIKIYEDQRIRVFYKQDLLQCKTS